MKQKFKAFFCEQGPVEDEYVTFNCGTCNEKELLQSESVVVDDPKVTVGIGLVWNTANREELEREGQFSCGLSVKNIRMNVKISIDFLNKISISHLYKCTKN